MRVAALGADRSTSGEALTGAVAVKTRRDVAVGDAAIVGKRMVAGGSFANCRWASLSAQATVDTTRRPTSNRESGDLVERERVGQQCRRLRCLRATPTVANARAKVVQITDVS